MYNVSEDVTIKSEAYFHECVITLKSQAECRRRERERLTSPELLVGNIEL